MKNFSIWLFSLLFILSGSLAAQSVLQKSSKRIRQAKAPASQINYSGFEAAPEGAVEHYTPTSSGPEKIDREIQVGRTLYDLQSNSSSCNRISMTPAGRVVATWTQGLDEAAGAYPDRGTGYNTRVDGEWGDMPEERLESVRTGWPNHVFTASGKEFIVAHTVGFELSTLTRENATDTWAEAIIPSTAPGGQWWPRAAVGGADGETIHVIAITTPVGNGGTIFEGVDGHVLYHRSTDSGASWDKVDIQIEGLGSDFTLGTDADSYHIDARGDVVAFAIFNGFDDLLLFKSEDNGDTWNKTIVNDFPLELYQVDDGYSYEDIPPFDEEISPDSLAIYTSDGFGTVLIDHDGKAHVFFGEMFVLDDNLTDGNTSYFPGTDGLAYWNEDYIDLGIPATTILGVVDQNGNDSLDIQGPDGIQAGLFFSSLTSMPSAGVDAQGNLFVTYSSLLEGEVSIDQDMQHYRHVYVSASLDGGVTWAEPIDLITPEISFEPDLVEFAEGVFPTMVRDVDSHIRLIYQQDYRPGLAIRGDEDEAADNYISYIEIPLEDFAIVNSVEPVEPATFDLQLAPNVTADRTMASFTIDEPGQVSISLMNAHGQLLNQLSSRQLPAGSQQEGIDLSNYASGVYYLMLQVENASTVVEVIKQ